MTLDVPISEPRTGAAGLRTALFLVLLAFLNLQADGLHLSTAPRRDQLVLFPVTLLFCVLLATLVWPWTERRHSRLATFANSRTLLVLAAGTLLPTFALLVASAHHYATFRYHLPPWPTLLVFLGASVLLLSQLRRAGIPSGSSPATRPDRLLTSVLIASLAVQLLCLHSFPLDVRRSDMLPLLAAAGRALHLGINPYRVYTFPTETVLLTYLPGTLLAYLPTTLLHLDLRLTNLLCVTFLALLVTRAAAPAHSRQLTALFAIWLLSPYLVYRHEIYSPPHWLALIASLLLLYRGRFFPSAVLFGLSIALSQFSWILFPFVLLHIWERHRTGPTLRYATLALVTAAIVVLPFLAWSPHDFIFGVLSHWQQQTVNARPVNLSFWLATLLSPRVLQPAQLAALSAIFVVSAARHSCRSFPGLLRALSLALAAFILLNLLVWGYFFLLLELLLLLFVASANGWLRPVEPALQPL